MNVPVGTHKIEFRGTLEQIWQLRELQLIRKVNDVWRDVVGGESGERQGWTEPQSAYKLRWMEAEGKGIKVGIKWFVSIHCENPFAQRDLCSILVHTNPNLFCASDLPPVIQDTNIKNTNVYIQKQANRKWKLTQNVAQLSFCGKRLTTGAQRKACVQYPPFIPRQPHLWKWNRKEAHFKENKGSGFIVFKELFLSTEWIILRNPF